MAKKKAVKKTNDGSRELIISPPNFEIVEFHIRGTSPYMQNKFSEKAKAVIRETQEAGSTSRKGRKRERKDFQESCEGATYRTQAGWMGIPATSFRNAMISACKIVGFQMTRAKLSVFVLQDGEDASSGTPLVRITKGQPTMSVEPVRVGMGTCDLRARPQWSTAWEAKVRVQFDADQFTVSDVANLLVRAGLQVGVGEGRPDSKASNGINRGTFEVLNKP